MTTLTLVEMHDLADAIEGLLGVCGLAVPDAPVQPLGIRVTIVAFASLRPCCRWSVRLPPASRAAAAVAMWSQSAIGGVVAPAARQESITRPGTAVGERSHLCGSGSADRLEATADLNRNVSVGLGDVYRDLPRPPSDVGDVAQPGHPNAGDRSRSYE